MGEDEGTHVSRETGSEGCQIGSEGCPPVVEGADGSEGCQIGSDGCRSSGDMGGLSGSPDDVVDLADWGPPPTSADQRRRAPAPRLPGSRVLADYISPADESQPERKDHRVTVRLGWAAYSNLEQAAALYAVRPTTLARMLLNRGVRSILVEFRRDEIVQGPMR